METDSPTYCLLFCNPLQHGLLHKFGIRSALTSEVVDTPGSEIEGTERKCPLC